MNAIHNGSKFRYLLRFFDCLAHPNLSATFATDQKWPICHLLISYQSLAGRLHSLKKSEFLKLIILIFHVKKFCSVAKVALRFGCAKQSKILKGIYVSGIHKKSPTSPTPLKIFAISLMSLLHLPLACLARSRFIFFQLQLQTQQQLCYTIC